jgi:hypothetical protein
MTDMLKVVGEDRVPLILTIFIECVKNVVSHMVK